MILFILGVLIIMRQAGIYFDPPSQVSIPLLAIGALMSNVPGVLHVLAWRFGPATGSPSSVPAPLQPSPQQGPLPAQSGGEK